MIHDLLLEVQPLVFLAYFVALNAGYLTLNVLSVAVISRYMAAHSLDDLPRRYSGFEPPVSVLVPAYNEEATIASSVRSLLQLVYPTFEIIVVNDGSTDATLPLLVREFHLEPDPVALPAVRLGTAAVRCVYRSTVHPNVRVVDKGNGGKADALNAGINLARYPYFCSLDADSILQRDSLERVMQPFLEDSSTVAAGGTVRIANGCDVRDGFLVRRGVPGRLLPLMQIVEYLRAFLFGRLGWVPLNSILVISGAFGVFHKETVVSVGGYRRDTIGEDMELVVRLHRVLREREVRYRIEFVPDPICWTEAPEDLATLRSQRIRWQRGLCESLTANRGLLFSRRGGAVGWVAFPFMLVFEMFGPIFEVGGYLFVLAGLAFGFVSPPLVVAFFVVAVGFGILLSVSALFLEELTFYTYPRMDQLLLLVVAAIVENFGYRQLNSVWRLVGLWKWVRGKEPRWGRMQRSGRWTKPPEAAATGSP